MEEKVIRVDEWNDLGGELVYIYEKEKVGKHIIQVFIKNADQSYSPIELDIKDNGRSVILSGVAKPFEGYILLR